MARTTYNPQFKAKLVLEVLSGETESIPICCGDGNGSFLTRPSAVFEDPAKAEKEARREERRLKKESDQMLKTIGRLTLERDFLQGCFRQCGLPVPELGAEK